MWMSSRLSSKTNVPASMSRSMRFEAVDDRIALGVGDQADLGEHGGMGDGAGDVLFVDAAVVAEIDSTNFAAMASVDSAMRDCQDFWGFSGEFIFLCVAGGHARRDFTN